MKKEDGKWKISETKETYEIEDTSLTQSAPSAYNSSGHTPTYDNFGEALEAANAIDLS